MKRKNATRNALFTSVLSLLLCVSMLVGTTFAWFTDEVVTGMNTIAAGNLDVELLANGNEVKADTELFKLADPNLWEPGVVAYENLQVANVGTLALKYQMTLNIGNENDLNGHKLSEVLKVAVLDEAIEAGATRADVLAAAKAALADPENKQSKGNGALSNFYLTGELEAKTESAEQAVVIFWDPNDNATDNLYNANNGKPTSDGEPLHIEFGINLQATQKMSESDSFGNDYDEPSAILPKATVNNTGAKTVPVLTGYDAEEIALDTSFQFLPNETAAEAAVSEYKNWHADYVVSADRDVPAGSIALAGWYEAWCGDNGWVVLSGDEVKAGEEVRLVAGLLNGTTVSYEEICQYGNDGEGFRCGAADLTGENAGTTITVELRMYETDPDSPTLSTTESETGHYEVIGTYSYTFAMGEQENVTYVKTADELQNALDNAQDGAVIAFAADITGDVVATQKADVDVTINGCGKKFTGVMTVFGNGRQNGAESLTIKDVNFVAAAGAESCIVSPDENVYNKHSYTHNITVEGCTFNDPDGAVNCAAIRATDAGDKNWIVRDCTVDNTMHSLLQVSNINGKLTVTGCEVNSKNGVNLNTTTNLEMTNCSFDVKGYAVRFGVNSGGNPTEAKTFVIKNSTLKSACDDGDAVIIFRTSAANASLTLTNTALEGTTEISGNTDATTITRN